MSNKFLKTTEKAKKILFYSNPVDWYNRNGAFVDIFSNVKDKNGTLLYKIVDSHTILSRNATNETGQAVPMDKNIPSHILNDDKNVIFNLFVNGIEAGTILTLFETLTLVMFEGNYKAALNYVEFRIMKKEVPFIRVGNDYFKIIYKKNRYGVSVKTLKHFKKETITDDYGKALIKEIAKFDDFTIMPDNIQYKEFTDSFYNLYAKFPHTPINETATENDFKHIKLLLTHIFSDQLHLAYRYMKVLYMHPQQILPVLVLASTERQTGKTTFLNLLEILFADNYVQIAPDELQSSFNSIFATKNIIAIDETVMEKQSSVEKIKSIATQKSISVNQKFVSQYKVPFFGKIVIGTNRERDFMRIDEEEIRFWVRRVPPITSRITDIEEKMTNEIPAFLKFLIDLPAIDFTKSRMIFTEEEIRTDTLDKVVAESRSTLYKELFGIFEDYFNNNENIKIIEMASIDIKMHWFQNNNQISASYISKVLKDEFKFIPTKLKRYKPIVNGNEFEKVGKPFVFERNFFTEENADFVNVLFKNDMEVPF
jgi:hypothetical protein